MASSLMDCGTPTATSTWACAEKCAADHGISRDDQDAYAELSYERSRAAKSFHAQEIVPVEVKQRKKTILP